MKVVRFGNIQQRKEGLQYGNFVFDAEGEDSDQLTPVRKLYAIADYIKNFADSYGDNHAKG